MIGQSEIPDFVFEAEPKAFSDTTPCDPLDIWPTSGIWRRLNIGLLCSH